MATPVIKTATASDEIPATAVMMLAFDADPAVRWTWPDPQHYLKHFPDLLKALGGKAFSHGTAYCVDGYIGAALWLPPGVEPDENTLITMVQRTVAGRGWPRSLMKTTLGSSPSSLIIWRKRLRLSGFSRVVFHSHW